MPRWSPVASTICYGRVERSIMGWMDMVRIMDWVPYYELVWKVSQELGSDPTPNLRSEISRACRHLSTDIRYLERYPAKRTKLVRRLF